MKVALMCFALALVAVNVQATGISGIRDSYKIFCTGNCGFDYKTNNTSAGAVLMGGGTDTDEAFIWQISRAGGGDFVVLRTSGDDAYNEWIMGLSVAAGAKLNSVSTILFNNAKGSQETEVLTLLSNAEAIFMAGGDQSEYLDYWVGTEVQTILQSKLTSITIGGTSAGCAMLGNWVYTGSEGSAVSDECLEDPYNKYVDESSIVPAFLNIPFLETVITDTHFVTRDRMGRMLTFVGRILQDSGGTVALARGVGVDEHTALLLDTATGEVSAVGVGTAYVCTADHAPLVCQPDTPLTFQDVSCVRLDPKQGDTFSFSSFSGGGLEYPNNIVAGHFSSLPYGKLQVSTA